MFQEAKIREAIAMGQKHQKDQMWTMLVWNLSLYYVCIIKVCCAVNDVRVIMTLLLYVYRTVHEGITQ